MNKATLLSYYVAFNLVPTYTIIGWLSIYIFLINLTLLKSKGNFIDKAALFGLLFSMRVIF